LLLAARRRRSFAALPVFLTFAASALFLFLVLAPIFCFCAVLLLRAALSMVPSALWRFFRSWPGFAAAPPRARSSARVSTLIRRRA